LIIYFSFDSLRLRYLNGKELTVDRSSLSTFVVVRSIAYIVFGMLALIWPGVTLATLAIATAIWLIVSGIAGIFTSIGSRDEYQHWILRLILAISQVGVGAYLVQRPGLTIATYVLVVGLAFVVEGISEIAMSIMMKDLDSGSMILRLISGFLAIIAGIIIWRYPVSGSLSFVWVVGLIAVFNGSLGLAMAASEKK
jgi:uncharacterized membrane protein HdeD (DUF308 family)